MQKNTFQLLNKEFGIHEAVLEEGRGSGNHRFRIFSGNWTILWPIISTKC